MNSWEDTSKKGAFVRKDAQFRDHSTSAETSRYHLYVSLACPWAHRTLITRELKGLTGAITVDVVDHFLSHKGWTFGQHDGGMPDRVNDFVALREVYEQTESDYSGRITVPVFYDKHTRRIVNNESSEIIRILNADFQEFATHREVDLYPRERRTEIDAINTWVYPMINNGVYKCGFARSQAAYDHACSQLFEGLDRAEALLRDRTWLTGDRFTEADIRLFTTLARFDLVYFTHFKCNVRRLSDYPELWDFTRAIYQHPAVKRTTDFFHIKEHYYRSHESINPFRIVPAGPLLDFEAPTRRQLVIGPTE